MSICQAISDPIVYGRVLAASAIRPGDAAELQQPGRREEVAGRPRAGGHTAAAWQQLPAAGQA